MQILNLEDLEKLKTVISGLKNDVAILGGIADPDSLACSQIIAHILKRFEKIPHIFFQNDQDDPNIAIWVNSFELVTELSTTSVFLEDQEKYSIILLDFNDIKIIGLEPGQIKADIVIDHHEKIIKDEDVVWYWIDKYGAATSMMLFILMQLEILSISEDENLSTQCVTAINADLGNNLLSSEATLFDIEMFAKARVAANIEKAQELVFTYYNKKLFNLIGEAWKNHSERGKVIVTHTNLGSIKENDHTYLAVIADFLYKFTCFDIVIVWAKSSDTKRLMYKARSGKKEMSLDYVIKTQFGESGGARAGKGAGSLPTLPKVFNPLDQEAEKAFIIFMQCQMFAIASQYASE